MLTFSIEITKNYRLFEFREDIKKLYTSAGCENKRVVFLFNDTQIKDEGLQALHAQLGFKPQELFQRLGIRADLGHYRALPR
eukprot:gene31481-biopygen25907